MFNAQNHSKLEFYNYTTKNNKHPTKRFILAGMRSLNKPFLSPLRINADNWTRQLSFEPGDGGFELVDEAGDEG